MEEPQHAWVRGRLAARVLAGLLVTASVSASALVLAQSASGGLRGTVVDADFGSPLPNVRVTLIEAGLGAITSADGTFLVRNVPPGRYTVSLSKDGYDRKLVPDVSVPAGQLADIRAELSSTIVELEEMLVTGSDIVEGEMGLLDLRAESTVVQDAVSSDLLKKAGASDVGGALKLVVGASVVGGKYATVRGLSDRYTGTTLNGVRIPSADPRKRAAQVDLFPTETIESVTVTKTFTPDLQGDFTGGGVDIKTKSIPERAAFSFSFGGEYNSLATGEDDYLSYREGGVSAFGFAGDDRKLPAQASGFPPKELSGIDYSTDPSQEDRDAAAYYDGLTRSFAPAMGSATTTPGPNYGFSLSGGNRFTTDSGGLIGVLGALTYSRKYDYYADATQGRAAKNVDAPLAITKIRSEDKGAEELLIGGLGAVVFRPSDDHELSLRLIGNQSAQDEARFQFTAGENEQNQSLQYTQRTVASAQLAGTHTFGEKPKSGFGPYLLDWVGAFNLTRQWEPDVRFFRNFVDPETGDARMLSNSTDSGNTRRIFRDIHEDGELAQVNFTVPFTRGQSEGKLKAGLYGERANRELTQDSFTYSFQTQFRGRTEPGGRCNQSRGGFSASSPDELWTDVFTDVGRAGLAPSEVICPELGQTEPSPTPAPNQLLWAIYPLSEVDVNYVGDQAIDALYGMVEYPIVSNVKLIAGARRESTKIDVVPSSTIGVQVVVTDPIYDDSGNIIDYRRSVLLVQDEQATAKIDAASWLPAAAVIWEPKAGMNVRASWTKTIARPTFRELAPVLTEEYLQGDEFLGNFDLVLSDITNYDVRWEWFPAPGRVLSASLFYKEIENPIEYISFTLFGSRTFIQPVNYEHGTLRGWEVEARTPLEPLGDWLRGFSVGANFTSLRSEVDVPEFEQLSLASFDLAQETRELQGQPRFLFNLNATYDNLERGISAGIFYTRTGDTLLSGAAVGENGTPNVYELERGSLDLSYSQVLRKLGPVTSFTVRAKNVLAAQERAAYRTPQGEQAARFERETARTFALGFSFKY